jgi:hypothetical protein
MRVVAPLCLAFISSIRTRALLRLRSSWFGPDRIGRHLVAGFGVFLPLQECRDTEIIGDPFRRWL